MRFVLLSAIAVTLATASFLGTMAPAGPTAMPAAPPASDSPRPDGMWAVERLVRELADAVMHKDLKRAADTLADDAIIRVTGYSCDPITKSTFIGLLNNTEIAAQMILILESAVSVGFGVFHYQDAFLAAKGTQWENQTFNSYGLISAQATADGKQLALLQKFTDTSMLYPNVSTALMTAWNTWANATVNSDVAALNAALNASAEYTIFEPNAKAPTVLNRSMVLEGVAYDASHRQFEKVTYDLLYPSCELVVTLLTSYTAMNDGTRFVNKYFIAGEFDSSLKLYRMSDFPVFDEDGRRHH